MRFVRRKAPRDCTRPVNVINPLLQKRERHQLRGTLHGRSRQRPHSSLTAPYKTALPSRRTQTTAISCHSTAHNSTPTRTEPRRKPCMKHGNPFSHQSRFTNPNAHGHEPTQENASLQSPRPDPKSALRLPSRSHPPPRENP